MLRWTSYGTYDISTRLKKKGYKISQRSVYSIMLENGYIMRSNKKKSPEDLLPDFDMQFSYIHEKVKEFQNGGLPAISLDMLKYLGNDDFMLHDLMKAEAWRGAGALLIMVDNSRTASWKYKIQDLSNLIRLPIHICHLPPWTRKWDHVEFQTRICWVKYQSGKVHQGCCSVISLISPVKEGSVNSNDAMIEKDKIYFLDEILQGQWNYVIEPSK